MVADTGSKKEKKTPKKKKVKTSKAPSKPKKVTKKVAKPKKAAPKPEEIKKRQRSSAKPKTAAKKKVLKKDSEGTKDDIKEDVVAFPAGSIKVNLYSLDGSVKKKVTLPKAFETEFRPDLIRRAVVAAQANRRQPYGPNPRAGMRHASSTWGKGRGVSRVQRMTDGRTAVESPGNVGGRRSHPPTPEHDLSQKINRKERQLARNSALRAITSKQLVSKRGHRFDKKVTVPLIVPDDFSSIQRCSRVIETLENLGVSDDLIRAKKGRHIRAGRGKMRGRKYRIPKSVLIIVSEYNGVEKAANNLSGVDITTPENLNTEALAPGGHPGRLTIITQSAIKKMEGW